MSTKAAKAPAIPDGHLPVDAIRVGKRFRVDLGDIEGLAASIIEVGLLHPIVVTPTRDLIAGERRLIACRGLGWTTVPVTVVDLPNLLAGEAAENAVRKDFTPSEAVAITAALRPVEAAAAKVRETLGKVALGSDKGRARDRVASAVGMSGRTLEKAEAVVRAVDANPELAPIVEQMDATGNVDRAYRAVRSAEAPAPDYIDHMPAGPIRDHELAFRAVGHWQDRVGKATGALLDAEARDVVASFDRDAFEFAELQLGLIESWVGRTRQALRKSGAIRVVGGAR